MARNIVFERACLLLLALTLLAGCRYRPKDAKVFTFKTDHDVDRVFLLPPEGSEARKELRLKFIDTNTYTTTAPLSPGKYTLTARSSSGYFYSTPVEVVEKTWWYDLGDITKAAPPVDSGPKVGAQLYSSSGQTFSNIVVLFIGQDLIVRRTTVEADKQFSVIAPGIGTYRIEVIALGNPVQSWVRDNVEIRQSVNLGTITLK